MALSADTTRLLRERYDGCLCLRCLADVQAQGDTAHPASGMKKPAQS